MARLEAVDSGTYSAVKQLKSPGGNSRRLPVVGPSAEELSKIHLNGALNSEAQVEDLREYLLGRPETGPKMHTRSRNFRPKFS